MVNRRPKLELITPTASPEEAAAIVAALERFMRATAPTRAPAANAGRPVAPGGAARGRGSGSIARMFHTPG